MDLPSRHFGGLWVSLVVGRLSTRSNAVIWGFCRGRAQLLVLLNVEIMVLHGIKSCSCDEIFRIDSPSPSLKERERYFPKHEFLILAQRKRVKLKQQLYLTTLMNDTTTPPKGNVYRMSQGRCIGRSDCVTSFSSICPSH